MATQPVLGSLAYRGLPARPSVPMAPQTPAFAAPDPATAAASDPYYQFRQSEGLKQMQRGAAAKGTLLTGGFQKALVGWGQGLASEEGQNAYNRALTTYTTNRDTTAQNFNHDMSSYQGSLGGYNADAQVALERDRLDREERTAQDARSAAAVAEAQRRILGADAPDPATAAAVAAQQQRVAESGITPASQTAAWQHAGVAPMAGTSMPPQGSLAAPSAGFTAPTPAWAQPGALPNGTPDPTTAELSGSPALQGSLARQGNAAAAVGADAKSVAMREEAAAEFARRVEETRRINEALRLAALRPAYQEPRGSLGASR